MDKLMYFLAGLAFGHILSKKDKGEKQEPSPSAFVPLPFSVLHQMHQMQQMGQHAAQLAHQQQPPPKQPEQAQHPHRCTFKCWLCAGTTTFQYPAQPDQQQFQVECSRCGMDNLVKIPSQQG